MTATIERGTSASCTLNLMVAQGVMNASIVVDPAISGIATLADGMDPFGLVPGDSFAIPLVLDVPMVTSLGTLNGRILVVAGDGQVVGTINIDLDVIDPPPGTVPIGVTDPSHDRIGTDSLSNPLVLDAVVVGLDVGTVSPDARALQIAAAHGGTIVGSVPSGLMYQVRFTNVGDLAELESLRQAVLGEGDVAFASKSYLSTTLMSVPNDPRFDSWNESDPQGNNWNLEMIRAPTAWSTTTGDPTIGVAIIDADIDLDHEDLADNRNIYEGRPLHAETLRGHGTHVAGIACAVGNNHVGIAGVAWHCSLSGYEFASAVTVITAGELTIETFQTPERAAELMLQAADDGARVVNLSFGIGEGTCAANDFDLEAQSRLLQADAYFAQAIELAQFHGHDVLWVVAAGNNVQGETHTCDVAQMAPANLSTTFPNVMTVASVNSDGHLSNFSNFGPGVSVAAPGGERTPFDGTVDTSAIYSTLPRHCGLVFFCDSYGKYNGTSQAAPHVTGLAVLVMAAHPGLSAAQTKACIVDGAVSGGIAVEGHEFHVIDAPSAVACSAGGG